MEENKEELRGKQIKWHKLVKEQVFSSEEHITVRRITDKATNMKRSWKEARAMQQRSGCGVKAEDNETSIDEALERRCPLFWRLDEIWASRPNVTLTRGSESTEIRPKIPSQQPSEIPSQIPLEIRSQIRSEIPSQMPSVILSSSSSSSESPPPVPPTSRSQGNLPMSRPKRSCRT